MTKIDRASIENRQLSQFIHYKNEGYLNYFKVIWHRLGELIFGSHLWLNHQKMIHLFSLTKPSSTKTIQAFVKQFKKASLNPVLKAQIEVLKDKILLKQYPKSAVKVGTLELEQGWSLHYEESGNPDGLPVVFVHGGPGFYSLDTDHCWFDPTKYRIITFDQRGTGRSKPSAQDHNVPATTFASLTIQQLASDMEKLRDHLKIKQWLVFGGSWGSTLSLFYGQEYPERSLGLILRGVCLATMDENRRFFESAAMKKTFGDKWDPISLKTLYDYVKVPLDDFEGFVKAFRQKILVENDHKAMHLWPAYEDYVDDPTPEGLQRLLNIPLSPSEVDATARALGIHETHFYSTLPDTLNLLAPARIQALQKIPITIVQGKLDTICPPQYAKKAADLLPHADFKLIKKGKHSSYGKEMTDALVKATDAFYAKLTARTLHSIQNRR